MGRTPKTYEPTGMGIAINIPARRHDVLADILIDAVRASASGEDAQEAATRIARAKGVEHGARRRERLRPGRVGPERALTIISELLDAGGYEPQRESPTAVRLRNCPFQPLSARAPDVVCLVDRSYLSGLLAGLEITTVKMIPDHEPGNCCAMFTGIQH